MQQRQLQAANLIRPGPARHRAKVRRPTSYPVASPTGVLRRALIDKVPPRSSHLQGERVEVRPSVVEVLALGALAASIEPRSFKRGNILYPGACVGESCVKRLHSPFSSNSSGTKSSAPERMKTSDSSAS